MLFWEKFCPELLLYFRQLNHQQEIISMTNEPTAPVDYSVKVNDYTTISSLGYSNPNLIPPNSQESLPPANNYPFNPEYKPASQAQPPQTVQVQTQLPPQQYPPQQYPQQVYQQPIPMATQQVYAQPYPQTYVQVQPSTATNTVYVSQSLGGLGDTPAKIKCPHCQFEGMTTTSRSIGLGAWLAVLFLFVLGWFFILPWLICWIPLVIPACWDVTHSCSNCKRTVGTHKLI